MTLAFTFPGQGSQAVGMGKALAGAFAPAREVFEEVDDALDQKLSRLMFEGPAEDLTLTENAQPALMAVSLAVMAVLEAEGGITVTRADFVAGHSLGEYSALAAAGTFSLSDTARLLKIRGQAMQRAVPVGEGAMAALLGIDLEPVVEIARAASEATGGKVCQIANDNAPGQVVISGAAAAVEAALDPAREAGARRAVMLDVSAPFHCSLMQPAADAMAEALADIELAPPAVPVVANVSASATTNPAQIRRNLVAQVTAMVRWRETVLWLAENGVTTLYEIGTGKVLSGLARRIDRDLKSVPVGTPDDIEAAVKLPG
ncbi:Malonyl CoA-acyl carrier protein transacylase [hydrothermal vent metagenome]|uniref:[acyl-carrier-protein] S-malonyltransferase n=1 Tax=hydrothermal vent metagenome TaxID=652676 RepID=A0A3B0TQK6_9ZZZZ